ncbi:MAG: TolC family protein [Treponema sp.]|nr:TolC family protein [Treponema sp.]MCL2180734.1 TolC family protein [Treponema sp.]
MVNILKILPLTALASRTFASLFFFLVSCSALFSQTVNLEQARLYGLAASRSLARYDMDLRSSILNERNQLYTMLPSISANYGASMNFFRDWEFVNPVDTLSANVSVSITQVIFQGGRLFIQRALSAISTESVRKEALAEYFRVLDSVDNAYYAVLEAAAKLEAAESSLQSASLNLSIAEIRHGSGIINTGEYLRILTEKERLENSRNQSRRSLTLVVGNFRSLTGISDNAPLELEQINFDIYEDAINRLARVSDEDAEELYNAFHTVFASSSPSLAIASLNRRRAEHNHNQTLAEYSPSISATLFRTNGIYTTANGFDISNGTSGINISGTIPIDFWVMNNRVERSRITRDAAMLSFAATESSLDQDLRSAVYSILTCAEDFLSSRRSLENSERQHEYYSERYRLSQSSITDLTDASSSLITSRNSQIRARYAFLQGLSKLRMLCAIADEERLLNILLGN